MGSLDMEPFCMPWDKGIVGMVAMEGQIVNLPGLQLLRSSCLLLLCGKSNYVLNICHIMLVSSMYNTYNDIIAVKLYYKLCGLCCLDIFYLLTQCFRRPDAHSHPAFDGEIEKKTGYTVKGLLSLPVKSPSAHPSTTSRRFQAV